jgi:hypothetical protein
MIYGLEKEKLINYYTTQNENEINFTIYSGS